MRYTAFLILGLLLIVIQGEAYLVLRPLATLLVLVLHSVGARAPFIETFEPSLLTPLLVFLGGTETNLALGASVAFVLGYVLDVVGGSPVGIYAFASVATLVAARVAGPRGVSQSGLTRALVAGLFAAFAAIIALVLLAIFGKSPYVPRAYARLVLPQAIATTVVAPLVFRIAARTQTLVGGFLEGSRPAPATATAAGAIARTTKDVARGSGRRWGPRGSGGNSGNSGSREGAGDAP